MPIRDRIVWGRTNPFGDPRLTQFDVLVREIRRFRRLPQGVSGGSVVENRLGDLPPKPRGYYREYCTTPPRDFGQGWTSNGSGIASGPKLQRPRNQISGDSRGPGPAGTPGNVPTPCSVYSA